MVGLMNNPSIDDEIKELMLISDKLDYKEEIKTLKKENTSLREIQDDIELHPDHKTCCDHFENIKNMYKEEIDKLKKENEQYIWLGTSTHFGIENEKLKEEIKTLKKENTKILEREKANTNLLNEYIYDRGKEIEKLKYQIEKQSQILKPMSRIIEKQKEVMEDIEKHPDYEDMCTEINGKEIKKLKKENKKLKKELEDGSKSIHMDWSEYENDIEKLKKENKKLKKENKKLKKDFWD
tara:strand:- start:61 stop:774 length:714 start_codon:yes stop_codon:yes gene_type:complete